MFDTLIAVCISRVRAHVLLVAFKTFQARLREGFGLAVESRYSVIEDEINHQEASGRKADATGAERPKARYSSVFFATEELALLHARCGRYSVGLWPSCYLSVARCPRPTMSTILIFSFMAG